MLSILFSFVVIFILMCICYDWYYENIFARNSIISWCVVSFMLSVVLVIMGLVFMQDLPKETYLTHKEYIVSLRNDVEHSIRFKVGIINSSNTYVTYVKFGNGGVMQRTISSETTTIYEDEDVLPYVEYYRKRIIPIKNWWFRNLFIVDPSLQDFNFECDNSYVLHVPKNTLFCEFTLK